MINLRLHKWYFHKEGKKFNLHYVKKRLYNEASQGCRKPVSRLLQYSGKRSSEYKANRRIWRMKWGEGCLRELGDYQIWRWTEKERQWWVSLFLTGLMEYTAESFAKVRNIDYSPEMFRSSWCFKLNQQTFDLKLWLWISYLASEKYILR